LARIATQDPLRKKNIHSGTRRTFSSSLITGSEPDGVDLAEEADQSTIHHQLCNKPKELKSHRALIKRRTNNCIAPRALRLIVGESKKIKVGRIEM
jgi:hypothetical protein